MGGALYHLHPEYPWGHELSCCSRAPSAAPSHHADPGLYAIFLEVSGSRSVVPGPAASVSPGNFLKMQIPGPHPRCYRMRNLGVELSNLCFDKASR